MSHAPARSADVFVFFNFRSPYCYLASKNMFSIFDDYHTNLIWRPLGGWSGRSPPDRAQKKMPIARQDMARFAQRMGIPVNPPPKTTDPTAAGAGSLYAEEKGLLRNYIVEVMRSEWGGGNDIGDPDVLRAVAEKIGLDAGELIAATEDSARLVQLEKNWEDAEEKGVIGVPTFVIGEEIFWGNDRIDFVLEHLRGQRLARL